MAYNMLRPRNASVSASHSPSVGTCCYRSVLTGKAQLLHALGARHAAVRVVTLRILVYEVRKPMKNDATFLLLPVESSILPRPLPDR